ncbi:hypothetical protein EH206_19285 [Brenneria nigrifluens DSM 30175 = ATCC 13028]|uniref:Uncharacterized protein n=1 Tax=Brenneria nigrifluens DSM 30175 = ATCC 13028 TaxID=1121120 RepID=A0A2U1UH61_9GAMM|nr:hypothetical protein DDT54_19675 [Brenneria nigrifluens DSM 30175 = ATCC 13028]QCR07031.1 hypothetical protein EH206_19285 [Brenneria nigrifluens DSM 30175 = ATCC 13028]
MFSKAKQGYRHWGFLFQATRIFAIAEGVSHRSLKHWMALTRRRLSQSAEALAGCPKTTSKPVYFQTT